MTSADVAELHRLVASDDHEGVVALCTRVIKDGKATPDIIASKVVACLHCNKFEEAVATCSNNAALGFEKAYALYKLDRLDEAWALLQQLPAGVADDASVQHLKAQVSYRQMRYGASVKEYEAIIGGMTDAAPEDLWDAQLNLLAAYVSCGKAEEALASPVLADSVKAVTAGTAVADGLHYELIYNIACALLDAGRPAAAATALEVAVTSGAALLSGEHGSEPEEVAEELAPLRAQAALLLQEAGYDGAAAALYSSMGATLAGGTRRKRGGASAVSADPATLAVAVSNLAGLHGHGRELVEGYTRIAAALEASTAAKLTRRQLLTLRFNRALLSFSLGRYAEVDSLLTGLKGDVTAAAKEAAAAAAGGKGEASGGMPMYLARLQDSLAALALAAEHVKKSQAGVAGAGTPASVASDLAALASTAASTARRYLSPVAAAHVQLLLVQGQAGAAADALRKHAAGAGGAEPVHPAVAVTAAQLYLTSATGGDKAGEGRALELLDGAIKGWQGAAGKAGAGATGDADKAHAVSAAIQCLHARAAVLVSVGQLEAAGKDLETIANKLEGATAAQKAAALAALAVVRTRQAGASGVSADVKGKLEGQARALLAEAAGLAGKQAAQGGAAADPAVLEWSAVGRKSKAAAAAGSAGAAAGEGAAVAAAPTDAAAAAAAAAAATKRAEAKKRRARAKRAKRRAAYLARLQASGKFDLIGIPRPDPERWIPKRERRGAAKRRGKGAEQKGSYGHQGGGDAGMAATLDARARAEKEKAAGGGPGSPATAAGGSAAGAGGSAKKSGGKGGKRR